MHLAEMSPAEQTSWTRWRAIERGDDHPKPVALYFEEEPPAGLLESGLYVNYDDFMNVRRDMGTTPESLAGIFHTLVVHFTQYDPRLHKQAVKQLRYNPRNRASWNREAYTYKYYLLSAAMEPYSADKVDAKHKILGLGKIGRQVLRAALFDQLPDEVEAELQAQAIDN